MRSACIFREARTRTERHIARVAHAGRTTPAGPHSAHGLSDRGVAEGPFALRGRRPLAACMVEDASRNGGAPVCRARGRRSAQGRLAACHAWPVMATRSAATGGKMRGFGVRQAGGNPGRAGDRVYHNARACAASRTCT